MESKEVKLRVRVVSDFVDDHLRGGGVPGKVMHSRRRQVMLIVLWDGPHLELSGTQAGVHTEVPVGALSQIPGLRRLELVAEVKAGMEAMGVDRHTLLTPPGMRDQPAVLGFQELLLQEVLLVQGLR